jgi:hypothetical protein
MLVCFVEYQLPSLDSVNPTTYEVYRGNFASPGMKEYHHQLQLYLLFFIERSSFIDSNDLSWDVLLICEKRTSRQSGKVNRCIVGYTTLYVTFVLSFVWLPFNLSGVECSVVDGLK